VHVYVVVRGRYAAVQRLAMRWQGIQVLEGGDAVGGRGEVVRVAVANTSWLAGNLGFPWRWEFVKDRRDEAVLLCMFTWYVHWIVTVVGVLGCFRCLV
jgi:hypothetical protein